MFYPANDNKPLFITVLHKKHPKSFVSNFWGAVQGETALSPKEQAIVLKALKKVGVTEEMKFDKYEENLNWND